MLRLRPVEDEWKPVGWVDPGDGQTVGIEDPAARCWHFIGQRLYQGRKRFQISKREAARRAGISEALWRQLEAGGKDVGGHTILPNPRPENLYAAARAVDEDPELFFSEAGWQMPEPITRDIAEDRLAHKIRHLKERDRQVVEHLVDQMLETDPEIPFPPPRRPDEFLPVY